MRYASAAAAERRSAAPVRNMEKTMRNRRDKCINILEPKHLSRGVLIGKRPSQSWILLKVDRPSGKCQADSDRCQKGITEGASIRHQSRIFANALRSRRGDRSTPSCGLL